MSNIVNKDLQKEQKKSMLKTFDAVTEAINKTLCELAKDKSLELSGNPSRDVWLYLLADTCDCCYESDDEKENETIARIAAKEFFPYNFSEYNFEAPDGLVFRVAQIAQKMSSNKEYMEAFKNGDSDKASEIFWNAMRKEIDEGGGYF